LAKGAFPAFRGLETGEFSMKLQMLIAAAALGLTAPALAQSKLADGPSVEGGDMTCFVASGYLAMAAEKAAAKPDITPEKRASAQKVAADSYEDNAFYIGRMTMFGKDKLSRDLYLDSYARFTKLSPKDQTAIIKICNDWARESKIALVKPWSSQP
jgi:hypothetical protein